MPNLYASSIIRRAFSLSQSHDLLGSSVRPQRRPCSALDRRSALDLLSARPPHTDPSCLARPPALVDTIWISGSLSIAPDGFVRTSRGVPLFLRNGSNTMYSFISKLMRSAVVPPPRVLVTKEQSWVHCLQKHTFSAFASRKNLHDLGKQVIPDNFVKWASLGAVRTSKFATGFTPLQPKPLDSIVDMERANLKSAEDLASIWDDHHLGRGHIGLSMKAQLYRLLQQRASDCRYFVIPLWRGSGYTTMFAQVQLPHFLFTGLEDYKARGTQAAPYFTVTFYTEFMESKELVLIRGDVVFTSKLSDEEAKWLLETAQSFYLNDTRYKLVERFNKQTRDFDFSDVLRTLDMAIL